QGMVGAFVAVADDATATWWNPAGVAGGPYFSSVIEIGRHPEPVSAGTRSFAIAYPALGFSYYRLDLKGLPVFSPQAATSAGRQDEEGINIFGLTAGQSLSNHLVVASTVK